MFPPKGKANKEETTELEAADDKVTGFTSLVMWFPKTVNPLDHNNVTTSTGEENAN